METNFKIPYLNEEFLIDTSYNADYVREYKKGGKISARINIDDAVDLFEIARPGMLDPNRYINVINELQVNLMEYYTEDESRMIVNLFKKIMSEKAAHHLEANKCAFSLEVLSINDLNFWDYLIDQSLYDINSVQHIDYFYYKDYLTYVAEINIIEYDTDMNVTDSFTFHEVLTDQIKDYWDFELDHKMEGSCLTHVIFTFDESQEMATLYVPFEMLLTKETFLDQILRTRLKSKKINLRKISTFIIQTPNQIEKMGMMYDEFISWYLACKGKFYFNEADK
jgi:hypothetical protein